MPDATPVPDATVRPARPHDIAAMARVHVRCWQQAYRGLMPDHVLDDPGFVPARERMWHAVLTEERYADNTAAVAVSGGDVVGIAMAGPAGNDADQARQLYVLYLDLAHHGSGLGSDLLVAVLDPDVDAVLWVTDPNPRAQAFYRKHGFVPDGTTTVEDGVTEVRMVRRARP